MRARAPTHRPRRPPAPAAQARGRGASSGAASWRRGWCRAGGALCVAPRRARPLSLTPRARSQASAGARPCSSPHTHPPPRGAPRAALTPGPLPPRSPLPPPPNASRASPACEREGGGGQGRGPAARARARAAPACVLMARLRRARAARARRAHPQMQLESTAEKKKCPEEARARGRTEFPPFRSRVFFVRRGSGFPRCEQRSDVPERRRVGMASASGSCQNWCVLHREQCIGTCRRYCTSLGTVVVM